MKLINVIVGMLVAFAVCSGLFVIVHTMPSAQEMIDHEILSLKAGCDQKGAGSKECRYLNTFGHRR